MSVQLPQRAHITLMKVEVEIDLYKSQNEVQFILKRACIIKVCVE